MGESSLSLSFSPFPQRGVKGLPVGVMDVVVVVECFVLTLAEQ